MKEPEKILLWGSNMWVLANGMLGPLFAVFTERIGGNILDVSWAYAVYLVVTGIGILIVGKLSDRYGKVNFMMIGYALSAVFTFGYLLVTEPIHLFIVQAGLGLALALSQATWYALYDKYSGDLETDGLVWGLAEGEGYIIAGGAIALGGLIVNFYSFDTLFIVMGTIHVIAALYQAKILKYERA